MAGSLKTVLQKFFIIIIKFSHPMDCTWTCTCTGCGCPCHTILGDPQECSAEDRYNYSNNRKNHMHSLFWHWLPASLARSSPPSQLPRSAARRRVDLRPASCTDQSLRSWLALGLWHRAWRSARSAAWHPDALKRWNTTGIRFIA